MGSRDDSFDLEKQKIALRLQAVENLIKEAIQINKKLAAKVYGDEEANPPIRGHEERIRFLEGRENGREKTKKQLLQLAIGSFTIAVGGIVLWILAAIKAAFIRTN